MSRYNFNDIKKPQTIAGSDFCCKLVVTKQLITMQSTELFKSYGDFYEVSNSGAIYSKERITTCPLNGIRRKKRRPIKLRLDKDGYKIASIYVNGKQRNLRVHRIVAECFIPNPDNKPFVNHINGIKSDNRTDNLEWCTQSENEVHAILHLGKCQPKGQGSKLSDKMIVTLPDGKEEIVYGQNEAARKYNLHQANIWYVLKGTYKQVKGYKFRYAT